MLADNVVELYKNIVYEQIQRYLGEKEHQSIRTRESYEQNLRYFFEVVRKKELKYLTEEDVQISLEEILDYRNYLKKLKKRDGERKYTNKSINSKITPVKEIIKYLAGVKNEKGEYIVKDYGFLSIIKILPENSSSYDALKPDEIIKMSEIVLQEKDKSKIKSLLLLFAGDTAIRKSAILKLKWRNFKEREHDYEIIGIDKGNKEFTKKISKTFYNELLTIKTDSPFVFDIKLPTVDAMFSRVRDKMNFDDGRWITFHSLRKCGGSFIYSMTKDLNATRLYLGHSSSDTTQLYIDQDDYGAVGFVSIRDSVDKELYKIIDHQTLLSAIDQLDSGQIMLINKKIMELNSKK